MSEQPSSASVQIDPWLSATRHVCAVAGCGAPCTTEPFAWRVTHDSSGRRLDEARLVEAFFCEQHETEIGGAMGFKGK